MTNREELEAVIAGAIEGLPMRDCADQGGELDRLRMREATRAVATALLSSGYTKGNGGTGLTDEEKAMPFMGDLSDESAGRVLKFVERAFVKAMADKGDPLDKIDGHETTVSSTTAAALFLVRHALSVNAASLKIDLGEADIDGEEVGDWVVHIRKGSFPTRGNGELVEAVRACDRFFRESMPLMNVANSCLDANAIDAWNKAEIANAKACKALSDSEGVGQTNGGDDGRELIPVGVLQKAIEIQAEGRDMHPLTCPNRGDAHHAEVFGNGAAVDVGTLMPISAYLVCVACGYQQDYSHPAAQFLLEAARSAASRASHQWRPS